MFASCGHQGIGVYLRKTVGNYCTDLLDILSNGMRDFRQVKWRPRTFVIQTVYNEFKTGLNFIYPSKVLNRAAKCISFGLGK